MPFSYKQIIPFIISLAMFMETVDSTIINTAIPVMSRSLQVNPVDLKIALISYLLSLAVFIPISGWIADKFGIKRVFVVALAVFTASSAWCGFSHSLTELVIARTVQGLGGSLTLPVGRLILLRTFERHELVVTMSRVVMVGALGLMLGPVLGGVITHYFSWQWIFWVNIPVGILALCIAQGFIKYSAPQKTYSLDKLGFVLFGAGLGSLTFGLSALSESNISKEYLITILLGSVFLLTCYVLRSRHQKHPIVNTKLFKARTFRISVLGNLLSRVSFGGVLFLLPLLMQIAMGFNAQLSGILLAPTAVGVVLVKFFVIRLIRWLGFRKLLVLNTMLVGFCLWAFMIIGESTSIYTIAALTFIFGFLTSVQYSSMNSLSYAEISSDDMSAATSIVSTTQQLSQSFSVAICALLLRFYAPNLQLSTHVFHQTFFAMGFLTFISILIFLRLKPGDGEQMIKRPESKAAVT